MVEAIVPPSKSVMYDSLSYPQPDLFFLSLVWEYPFRAWSLLKDFNH